MNSGYLCIVLHAHLPYVHHPEYEQFFEEHWLFEAISECYLPLVAMLDRLHSDKVDYRLTLSLSPTLLTMWRDPLLQSRYQRYLQQQLQLAELEISRTVQQPALQRLAQMYAGLFRGHLNTYRDHYQGDLLSAFLKHQHTGKLELITTAATHGFLPLLNVNAASVRNQIKVGIDTFTAQTGLQPRGFWLPECGYYPGLEELLKTNDIEYFFVDSHGLLNADPIPAAGVYQALNCPNGVSVFGRDPATSQQVWSATTGYPGDADYREFYTDLGFERDIADLPGFVIDANTRVNTGIKYYRVTGANQDKQVYDPVIAQRKARLHAADFISKAQAQISALSAEMPDIPVITAPFDAELFGHWWFEGPLWLEELLRLSSSNTEGLRCTTPGAVLDAAPPRLTVQPIASSWGEAGYSEYWLNASNDWIYPLLHKAGAELEKLVSDLHSLNLNELQHRALNQAVRSLLLAQASDWAFILKSGTTVEYAKKRVYDHLARFNYLHDAIRKNRINERYLAALEIMDDIFPGLDFRDYAVG